MDSKKIYIFTMSEREALLLDLVVCKCGHRRNDHFTGWTHPMVIGGCAHCPCLEYSPAPRIGKMEIREDTSHDTKS
jgi:hypothetical protein